LPISRRLIFIDTLFHFIDTIIDTSLDTRHWFHTLLPCHIFFFFFAISFITVIIIFIIITFTFRPLGHYADAFSSIIALAVHTDAATDIASLIALLIIWAGFFHSHWFFAADTPATHIDVINWCFSLRQYYWLALISHTIAAAITRFSLRHFILADSHTITPRCISWYHYIAAPDVAATPLMPAVITPLPLLLVIITFLRFIVIDSYTYAIRFRHYAITPLLMFSSLRFQRPHAYDYYAIGLIHTVCFIDNITYCHCHCITPQASMPLPLSCHCQ